ncbi:MAG TPA: aspartate aminotransferase family protein [Acidimicrobiia bacterium]|jgi:glutamate-1-semialdehyde 2,1-aminomutase
MGLQGTSTAEWFERAGKVLVGGVSSGFRYWGPDDTMVIDRGEGAYVWDMDGKRYIDYQLGFGPIVLGHAEPSVVDAVVAAAKSGTTFAMTTAGEVEAAEKVQASVGYVEAMRFTNTGTEATMHAVRLARAVTGRDLVLKFEGCYHGAHDYVLFSTPGGPTDGLGSRRSPMPLQASSGIPAAIGPLVRTAPFNDIEAVARILADEGRSVAAILVEPALGNCFGIYPAPGFLEGLRDLATEHGCVLVFDEVKTGFRFALGGAEEVFGVAPDIGTFAKSMGNGFPVAAIGGRREVLDAWSEGGIVQAGTYSGNGIAAAAVSATIDVLSTGEPHARIDKVGRLLMEGLAAVCADRGVPAHVIGHPAMFGLVFSDEPPADFRDTADHDAGLYETVIRAMVRRGVMPNDDGLEPWFVSAAHTEEDAATTLQAFQEALEEALG